VILHEKELCYLQKLCGVVLAVEDTKLEYAGHMTKIAGGGRRIYIYKFDGGHCLDKSTPGWKPEKKLGEQQKDRN
jgi:hypothetical protein